MYVQLTNLYLCQLDYRLIMSVTYVQVYIYTKYVYDRDFIFCRNIYR